MKAVIQIWGMLIVFMIIVFCIPQLMVFSVSYRQCSSIATGVVELIETHEGITETNQAHQKIAQIQNEYLNFDIAYKKENLANHQNKYRIIVTKVVKLFGSNIEMKVTSDKQTKRVMY